MDIDRELLLKSFVTETGEGLVQMEQALLELEHHPEKRAALISALANSSLL